MDWKSEKARIRALRESGETLTPAIDAWNDEHPDGLHMQFMKNRNNRKNELEKILKGRCELHAQGHGSIPDAIRQEAVNLMLVDNMTPSEVRQFLMLRRQIHVTVAAVYYWRKKALDERRAASKVVVQNKRHDKDPHSEFGCDLKRQPVGNNSAVLLSDVGNRTEQETANPEQPTNDVQIAEVRIQPDVQHTDNRSGDCVNI